MAESVLTARSRSISSGEPEEALGRLEEARYWRTELEKRAGLHDLARW